MRLTAWASITDEPLSPPRPSWVSPGAKRRQDPLTRLACAVVDQGLGERRLPADAAVVVATAYGSVHSTLRFAGSMAEHGDEQASPTPFTSSVHNATAGALGELLDIHGPTTTVSQGSRSTTSALHWAMLMVQSGRAPAALVVAGDLHNGWSERTVSELSGSPWAIGSGCAMAVIEAGTGAGHPLATDGPAGHHLLGGALSPSLQGRLDQRIKGQASHSAPEQLGAWWPTCLLSALPFKATEACLLLEQEGSDQAAVWLGPYQD